MQHTAPVTAVTYTTELPHTVLEVSTQHEEETNKGTKGNILKLINVIEGFSSLAEIVFKEMTQANTNADTEPTRKQQTDAAGTEATSSANNEPKTTTGKNR